jgi:predicted dehydrogenase/threonine dehydrogenase-like Zn-dependent dehydrogenase
MKQVVQNGRSNGLVLREVPVPTVQAGHLLVRTRASLISAGTERMALRYAQKSLAGKARARPELLRKVMDKARRDGIKATIEAVMTHLDEPMPLGYSACGEIVAVGHGLEGRFVPGARVAIAGAGLANHAELNLVPENLAATVPDDVSDEQACFGTLGAIALHAVRNLGLQLGDIAAVIGVGLVGQLAARFLNLAGIRVIAFDYDPARLSLAADGGAEMIWNLADGDPAPALADFTAGHGCDGVLIAAATDSSEPFHLAAAIARDRARITLVGLTGTEIPYREFMQKELSLVVSRSYGPGRYDADYEERGMKYPPGYVPWTETRNLKETVRQMSRNRANFLDVESLITHRIPFGKAEQAYAMVTENTEPHLGVVLTYDETVGSDSPRLHLPLASSKAKSSGGCILGVIGAGAFARAMLLPRLKGMKSCRLHTLVTKRSVSAGYSAESFGFEVAATGQDAVLENEDINAVLIATRHAGHAALTAAALAAGKNVLVEKPLALTREELNTVIEARNRSDAFFQVGFNRRFAPMATEVARHLQGRPSPRFVLMRINAGALPADSWQNAPEEGHGRILGELCHFVDLARFWIGAPINSVQAAAATVTQGACDDLTATLRFADGSLATIAYTAKGDSSFSKELFEAYAGGTVVTIDDFRKLTIVADGHTNTTNARGQDKGHAAQLEAFVSAVAAGHPAPVAEEELIESSLATIAVLESLQTGESVRLSP